ncbi:cell wall biogenesis protein [Metarhizium brunneum]
MDYNLLSTPPKCLADFNLVPIGTGEASIAEELAEVERLLKHTGVKHTMQTTGTVLEGTWDEVMNAIGKAHAAVHKRGVAKVQSEIRIGTKNR